MNSPVSCPPTTQRQLDSGLEAWVAAFEGTGAYWARAIERGAMPWDTAADAARWLGLMNTRRRPTWSTPNDVVLESSVVRLRDFSAGSRARVMPTLVLPPQAGHDSCIVDFSERQSQVQTIRAAGLERLWSLDYKGATPATREVVGRGLPRVPRPLDRAHRGTGEPGRRLPGRVAGDHLRRVAT